MNRKDSYSLINIIIAEVTTYPSGISYHFPAFKGFFSSRCLWLSNVFVPTAFV